MSVMDGELDPFPDFLECAIHHWVYPAGSICHACVNDINDEYADQELERRKS